jgi:hypothetical protein
LPNFFAVVAANREIIRDLTVANGDLLGWWADGLQHIPTRNPIAHRLIKHDNHRMDRRQPDHRKWL